MDKYEFNIKVEQIKKLVNKNDFATAMKIADTIDWRRVRNANLLSMISQVYEKNREYQEAKEVLLLAFERAPIGKRLLYKLTELALREGSVREAEDYYREFCDLAPEDPRQHILRYMIQKVNGAPIDQLIHSLERYTATELDEKWMYELAELYDRASRSADCVQLCDKMILMFGVGTYVERAMALKQKYAPLNNYQRNLAENKNVYEERLRAVEDEYENRIGSLQGFVQTEAPAETAGNYGGNTGYVPGTQGYAPGGGYAGESQGYTAGGGYAGENQGYVPGAGYAGGVQSYGAGGGYREEGQGYTPGGGYATENRGYVPEGGYAGGVQSYGAGGGYGEEGQGYTPGGGYTGESQGYVPGAGYAGGVQSYGAGGGYGEEGQGYVPGAGYAGGVQSYGAGGGYGEEGQGYTPGGGYAGESQGYVPGAGYAGGVQSYGTGSDYGEEGQGYAPGGGYGAESQGYVPEGGYAGGVRTYGAGSGYGEEGQGYAPRGGYAGESQGYVPGGGYAGGVQSYGAGARYGAESQGYMPGAGNAVENREYVPGAGYTGENRGYAPAEESNEEPADSYGYRQDSYYMEENGAYGSAADSSYAGETVEYPPEPEVTDDTYYTQEEQGAPKATIQRIPRAWNGPAAIPGMEEVDDELVANLHQAAAEKELAAEMSRISTEGYREPVDRSDMTKVFRHPRFQVKSDMGEEKVYRERYYTPHHLMIEASTAEAGFETAVEILKRIHQKTGANNQVIKITGSKLSKRGIFNVSDKLAGKDLIIEEAGDLRQEDLEELQMLLERDETGMVAVLIDNPYQMEELHQQNPGFVNLFKCINADEGPADSDWLEEAREEKQEEHSSSELNEEEVHKVPQEEEEPEEETSKEEEEAPEEEPEEEDEEPEEDLEEEEVEEPEEDEIPEEDNEEPLYEEEYEDEYDGDQEEEYEEEYEDEYDDEYDENQDEEYEEPYEEPEPIDDEELDLNDFADYAVNYAKEIDCSITGKSMLALYERIEVMEEDGIPLTRTNAEDLIEEAADKAEKPSLGGLIKGVFSSKYDKDGLLILKEEHFI